MENERPSWMIYKLSDYYCHLRLAETPLCLVDQSLKRCSRSPNKAAFALASWALIELDRLPITKWATSTVEILESHCNDSATLDSEALSMLVKSVSYVSGAHTFDHAPLLLGLAQVLALSRSSRSQVANQDCDRPDSLEIQGFVIARSGYNSRYLAEVVIPRVKPADNGSCANSELVRATYLSVVNESFLDTLTDPERLEALKLGTANLESATTNRLKQSCCNLIRGFARCDIFFDNGNLCQGESVTPLLPLFRLLPLLPLLHLTECTDERVWPYAMQALWRITALIGSSNVLVEEKQGILEPVLSHEPFASARSKTNEEVCKLFHLADNMGYADVWLSRLENVQGEALRHTYNSDVWYSISPYSLYDLDSNSELDSQSIRGRALALYRRCESENKAAGDRPLWPLDDNLAAS
ncbi:hypothetical protein FRC12_007595 [Ceratobasidium sp. 428]|nr:hypothetical protein FRC12_007595 [Ceratobasidium sp. 428]